MSDVQSLAHCVDLIKPENLSSDKARRHQVTQNSVEASQIQPIIHVHALALAAPWYNSLGIITVLFGLLSLAAFTLVSLSPLINAASSATYRVGDVIGTISNLGEGLGGTIRVVNRFGHGLADGIGDVRCAIIGGKGCGGELQSERRRENDLGGSGAGDLDATASLISTLSELSLIPLDLTMDIRLRLIAKNMTRIPKAQLGNSKWLDTLSKAGHQYHRVYRGREDALLRTKVVLQGLATQYHVTKNYTKATSFLDWTRNGVVQRDLARMAALTFQNDALAQHSLRSMYSVTKDFYKVMSDAVVAVRPLAEQLDEVRKSKLESRKCRWFGICADDLREVEHATQLLQFALPLLDELTYKTGTLRETAERLEKELHDFMAFFNSTAGITDDATGDIRFAELDRPMAILRKLDGGMTDLTARLGALPRRSATVP